MTIPHAFPTLSQFMVAGFNWSSSTIKCALLAQTYSFAATDTYWSDISAHEVTGAGYTSGGMTLANKTNTYDTNLRVTILSADSPQWPSVSITVRYAVFYVSTGVSATSRLLSFMDFEAAKLVVAKPVIIALAPAGVLRVQAG